MATWFATAAGDINTAGRWNSLPNGSGTTLVWPPALGDILVTNNRIVNVNVTTDLGATGEVRSDTTGGATAGGYFNFNTTGVTLWANIYASTASSGNGVFSNTAGIIATIVGNVYGGTWLSSFAINFQSSGVLNVVGNVFGGLASAATAISNYSGGTINITGMLSSTLNNAPAVYNFNVGTVNVTGDIAGCTTSGAQAWTVINASTGAVNLTGNAMANAGLAMQNSAGGTLSVSGYAQASATLAAINNAAQGIVSVGETRSASNGRGAVTGAFRYNSATGLIHRPMASDGSTLAMMPVSAFALPPENAIRRGVAFGADKVGTLAGVNRHHRMAA